MTSDAHLKFHLELIQRTIPAIFYIRGTEYPFLTFCSHYLFSINFIYYLIPFTPYSYHLKV
jgi:hypothetical protein